MASARLSFDQASQMLLAWYLELRAEHLCDDELDYELSSRLAIMPGGFSLSRKRMWLKDRLKEEKRNSTEKLILTVQGDPGKEMKICLQKFADLKKDLESLADEEARSVVMTRLVHVGMRISTLLTSSRGSPNLHSNLQNTLVELVEILEPHLGQVLVAIPDGDSDNGGQTQNVESEVIEPSGLTSSLALGQQMFEMMQSLQNTMQSMQITLQTMQSRVAALETDSVRQKEGSEVATQAPFETVQFSLPQNPSQHNQASLSLPSLQSQEQWKTIPSYRTFQNIPDQSYSFPNPINSTENHRTLPNRHPIPSYTSYNSFHEIPNNRQVQESLPRNPEPTSAPNLDSQPVPNQFHSQQFMAPYPSRHSLPVSKWNIDKYGGDDQGLKLNEFLELVQALSRAERVSEGELFESAIHLFKGSALNWYLSQRSSGRLMNWQHLVFELKRTYMHPDLDALIKMKIYQRRQQKHESFHEYYSEMEKLFRTMSSQIPNYEKVQIIQQNMRVDYKRQMTFIHIVDLETLVAAGQKLDALNFSAYNKVFGVEKAVYSIEGQRPASKRKQKEVQEQSHQSGSSSVAAFSTQQTQSPSRNNRNFPSYSSNPTPRPNPSNRESQNPKSSAGTSSNSTMAQTAGPSGGQSRPQLTLEDVVNEHKPPPPNTCFNCGRFGHHLVMCRQPREIVCSECGLRGFPTNFCPFCLKNGTVADENRRSQNSQA